MNAEKENSAEEETAAEAAAVPSPAVDVKYGTMFYKTSTKRKIASRRKFGDQKQIFSVLLKHLNQAQGLNIVKGLQAKLVAGTPEEEAVKWATTEVQKFHP